MGPGITAGNAGRDSGKRYTIRLLKSHSARRLVAASRVSGDRTVIPGARLIAPPGDVCE